MASLIILDPVSRTHLISTAQRETIFPGCLAPDFRIGILDYILIWNIDASSWFQLPCSISLFKRTLLRSRASETCSLPLKVRALNAHAPNVRFLVLGRGAGSPASKSFLSGHWSEPCMLVIKRRVLGTILACFGCSDEDIKIRTLSSNHMFCSKSCMKQTLYKRLCSTATAWGVCPDSVASACALSARTFSDRFPVFGYANTSYFKTKIGLV